MQAAAFCAAYRIFATRHAPRRLAGLPGSRASTPGSTRQASDRCFAVLVCSIALTVYRRAMQPAGQVDGCPVSHRPRDQPGCKCPGNLVPRELASRLAMHWRTDVQRPGHQANGRQAVGQADAASSMLNKLQARCCSNRMMFKERQQLAERAASSRWRLAEAAVLLHTCCKLSCAVGLHLQGCAKGSGQPGTLGMLPSRFGRGLAHGHGATGLACGWKALLHQIHR